MNKSELEKLAKSIIPSKSQKKELYSTWDEAGMMHALVSATRSKDPNKQVGTYITDQEHRPISLGYNGMPRGSEDDNMPWASEGEPLHIKDFFVSHAENNSILQSGNIFRLDGATLYSTLHPCHECAKMIANVKIGRVVYLSDSKSHKPSYQAAKIILHNKGVKLEEFNMTPKIDLFLNTIKELYKCNFY